MTDTSSADSGGDSSFLDGILGSFGKEFMKSAQDILSFGGLVKTVTATAADAVSGNDAQMSNLALSQAAAIKNTGEANATISDIEQAAAAKTKEDDSKVAFALGTDPQAMITQGQYLKQLADEINANNKEISSVSGASIFTDPLQWLTNQFTLPAKQEKADAQEREFLAATHNLQALQKSTDDSFRLNTSIDAATGADLAAAKRVGILNDASVKAAQATINALQYSNEGINVRKAGTLQQWDTMFKMNDAIEKVRADQRAQTNDDINKQMKEFQLEQKKDLEAQRQKITDDLKTTSTVLGIPEMNYQQYRGLSGKMKDTVDRAMFAATTGSKAGYGTYDAIDNIQKLKGNLTPGAQRVMDLTSNTVARFIGTNPNFKMLAPEQRVAQVNEFARQFATNELSDPTKPGSLYSPGPLNQTVKIPIIAATKLGQRLNTLVTPSNPDYPTRPDDIIAQTMDMIGKKETSIPEAAAQVSVLAKSLMLDTNTIGQFHKFDLPGLDSKSGYKAVIHLPGMSAQLLDLSNPAVVESFLTRAMSAKTLQDAGGGMFHY